jgi:hypothetical protein
MVLISVLALCACTPTASTSSPTLDRRRDELVLTRLHGLAPLRTARTLAGAALLNDGRVIVVGGRDGTGELASTEIYDPRTNRWASGPSLAVPRARFVLRNDSDLDLAVLGGESAGSPLASVEALRNFGATFFDGGALQTPRANFTASEVSRNVLELAGGGLASCEAFDLQAGDSVACPSLPSAVSSSAEAALASGDVFMPSQGAWLLLPCDGGAAEVLGAEPGLTSGFTTTMVAEAQVVTVAGARAWLYAPGDGGLFPLTDLAEARTSHRASLLPNGELLVFGGWGAAGALASGELWNGSGWASSSPGTAGRPRAARVARGRGAGGWRRVRRRGARERRAPRAHLAGHDAGDDAGARRSLCRPAGRWAGAARRRPPRGRRGVRPTDRPVDTRRRAVAAAALVHRQRAARRSRAGRRRRGPAGAAGVGRAL